MSLEQFYDLPEAEDRIAAWELDRETCKHHGGPLSECPDVEANWYPQRRVCYVEMQALGAARRYALIHEGKPYHDGTFEIWTEKPTLLTPFKYDDGVTIWMSREDLSPDDDFLQQRSRAVFGDQSSAESEDDE